MKIYIDGFFLNVCGYDGGAGWGGWTDDGRVAEREKNR